MYCKNCGIKLNEDDAFCPNCGQKTENYSNQLPVNRENELNLLFKDLKYYFTNPTQFYSLVKDGRRLKLSVFFFMIITIFSGLFHMLFKSSVIGMVCNSINKLPELLCKLGLISQREAADASMELIKSGFISNSIKSALSSSTSNTTMFFNGFITAAIIIVVTAILLQILNVVLLHNSLHSNNVLFISTTSYMPLILCYLIASISARFSLTFALSFIILGFILSFIRLYIAISNLYTAKTNMSYYIAAICGLLFVILAALIINSQIDSIFEPISNLFKTLSKLS